MKTQQSKIAFEEASKYIPGGVNSPVRALRSVDSDPLFIKKANACQLTDVDDNVLNDFCLSWGVFIAGHNHPAVKKSALQAIDNGTSYGIPSLPETDLAKMMCKHYPSIEKVRFVNSGTEAVMSAIRVARGFTGRDIIVKFDGCYHGHVDHMLVAAGSGVAGLSQAASKGVPADFTKYTISIPFNDKKAVQEVFNKYSNQIAAVIIEPIAANMGVVIPENGFLKLLRDITKQHGSLLIFDEVITGFRLGLSGAQGYFGITPDLTTLGKIIGGGFPAAAFGGRADIMDMLAPNGPVYQAGTLSGNPVAMSAGIATINILSEPDFYKNLLAKSQQFYNDLQVVTDKHHIQLNAAGAMFTLFFTDGKVSCFEDVKEADLKRFGAFFRFMRENRFYISPSQFEANFISSAHSPELLNKFIERTDFFLSNY